MAEPELKFGPEWLRNLSQGTALPTAPPSPGLPKYKLAEHRYGREEMLALLPKDVRMPPDLQQFDGLVKDVIQPPMALVPLAEDEQRMWSRSVNSDAVLRLMGRSVGSGPVGTVSRGGGRVGSVDRGRGRGRGTYFQRSLEDGGGEVGQPVGFSRQRSYERSNSLTERGPGWDDRDRRYDKSFARDDEMIGPQRKEFPRTSDWRSSARDRDQNGEDDGGWRGGGSRPDKWGRGSWRGGDRDERSDRHQDYVPAVSERSKGYRSRGHTSGGFWEEDMEGGGGLPEWSTEDNKDAESVGTFDATGAFLETKLNDERAKMERKRLEAKQNSEDPKPLGNSSQQGALDRSSPVDSSPALSKNDSVVAPTTTTTTKANKMEFSPNSSEQNSKSPSPDKPSSQPTTAKQRPQEQQEQPPFVPLPLESTEPKEDVIVPVAATAKVESSSKLLAVAAVENRLQQSVQKITQVNPVVFKVDIPSPIDKKEEVNFEHLKKAAESLVDTWTAEEEEKIEVARGTSPSLPLWYYRDPHGLVQGPFSDVEMGEWYRTGYFDMSLLVRRGENGRFCPLGELADQLGRVPFMPNVPQPQPQPTVNPVPLSNSALNGLLNPSSGTSLGHPTELPSSSQDPHLRLLHQQLLRQQFFQQQLFQQQQLLLRQQLMGLKQPDGYPSPNSQPTLTAQQQQQFLMQRILAQQQQQVPRPVVENGDGTDVLRQFAMMSGIQVKDPASLWNLPPTTVAARPEVSTAGPSRWGMSVWDIDSGPVTSNPGQMAASEVGLHEQQQRLQKLLLEEQQKKRLLGEEEIQRKQQQEAEERRRQKEKEEQRERERIRLEEIRRREEEARLEEELRRQEELRKQRELEERRLKEEEMRRKQQEEEFRRREEARLREEREREELRQKQQQEELRKQQLLEAAEKERLRLEEQKRLEELRWKHEEEKRRKNEEEKAKKQKEAEEKLEKEQQQKLKKQQQEVLKKLNEKRKAKEQSAAWGGQVKPNTNNSGSSLTLAEIQKIQEQKEHDEKVKRQLLQQQQQMEMLKQQQAAQQAKANLAWVNRPLQNSDPVKSLLEIQQEEAEKLAQQQLKEQQAKKLLQKQQQQVNQILPLTAINAWSNTTHLLRTNASVWSGSEFGQMQNDGVGTGFWDEAVNACNNTQKQQQQQQQQVSKSKAKSNSNKTKATSNHQENKTPNKAETTASNGQLPKQRSNKSKKEDNVMKLLDVHKRSNDEFTQWCCQSLSRMQSAVDGNLVPTFVAFLKDVDSPYEVSDYVRSYLGDNKDTRDFAKQFLEKRSHYRSQARKCEEENMWGPAPAINPSLYKPQGCGVADSDGFKTCGGCKKKKKSKMQKVDNTILGFTVHAANDRVNVGDIERVEDM